MADLSLLPEALSSDRDAFIASGGSPELWDAAHRDIKGIASAAGISVRQLAIRCGIPRRTIEDWSSGSRSAPAYILVLIQSFLGLL